MFPIIWESTWTLVCFLWRHAALFWRIKRELWLKQLIRSVICTVMHKTSWWKWKGRRLMLIQRRKKGSSCFHSGINPGTNRRRQGPSQTKAQFLCEFVWVAVFCLPRPTLWYTAHNAAGCWLVGGTCCWVIPLHRGFSTPTSRSS